MSEAIKLDDYIDETRNGDYPSRKVSHKSGSGGGDMDDVLKRLGGVESSVSELRVQAGGIAAQIPHLATKEGLKEVNGKVDGIIAHIPHLATKEDLKAVNGKVESIIALIPHFATKADLSAMETKIIKWMVGTVLTAVGLAFTIAKFVH